MKFRKRTQDFVNADADESIDIKGTKRPFTVMRRTASEIRNYRIIRRIVLISIAMAIAILLIVFGMTMIYTRTGRFSVSIKNPNETFSIALSENTGAGSGSGQMGGDDSADYSGADASYNGHEGNINNIEKHSRLINDGSKELNNISGDSLPLNLDTVAEGDHSTDGYFAYTFFCWNSGKEDVMIEYELTFNNVTNGVDECVRVRLYVEGEYTDYAKARTDEKGKEPVYCDMSFATKDVVCYGSVPRILVGDYARFTIVIWLEGDDPECTDSVIDGTIKFDMQIKALPTTA